MGRFIRIEVLKIIVLAYEGTIFKQLTKKKKVLGISEFSFRVIEPIQKDGKDKKFTKPHFRGK